MLFIFGTIETKVFSFSILFRDCTQTKDVCDYVCLDVSAKKEYGYEFVYSKTYNQQNNKEEYQSKFEICDYIIPLFFIVIRSVIQ